MAAKIRKEVKIDQSVVNLLKVGAERKGWSLKKYMEYVLFKAAEKNVPYSK
jgi:hypothetical protein